MRRAIALAVAIGLGTWAVAAAPARAGEAAAGSPAATKTVVYQGYELRVPAAWPVYDLDQSPSTCVRYDISAVYLGAPGRNMRCPAHLVGRTQTVSIFPGTMAVDGPGAEAADQSAPPGMTGGTRVANLPAVHGAIMQDAPEHQLRVTLSAAAPGATVVATYGGSQAAVEQMLASLRAVPAAAPAARQASRPSTAPDALARSQAAAPPPPPLKADPVGGFDPCTAPSLATMGAWRTAYGAVGIYIGGVNMACAYGNLSASWVRSSAAMGWTMLPTYVGPQAPCYGGAVVIDPGQAAAEGGAAATDAVSDAALFGLPKRSPIYYDMEEYDTADAGCVSAVLTFLGAWSRRLLALGYVPAVYSGQSGIGAMQSSAVAETAGFTVPTAIWIARWDGVPTLSDGTLVWPVADRSKQYRGPHNQTVGGVTLNIDSDLVGGPVAR